MSTLCSQEHQLTGPTADWSRLLININRFVRCLITPSSSSWSSTVSLQNNGNKLARLFLHNRFSDDDDGGGDNDDGFHISSCQFSSYNELRSVCDNSFCADTDIVCSSSLI